MTKTFEMDGDEHIVGDPKCCGVLGGLCPCGGRIHSQPLWDCMDYECDLCHKHYDYLPSVWDSQ